MAELTYATPSRREPRFSMNWGLQEVFVNSSSAFSGSQAPGPDVGWARKTCSMLLATGPNSISIAKTTLQRISELPRALAAVSLTFPWD